MAPLSATILDYIKKNANDKVAAKLALTHRWFRKPICRDEDLWKFVQDKGTIDWNWKYIERVYRRFPDKKETVYEIFRSSAFAHDNWSDEDIAHFVDFMSELKLDVWQEWGFGRRCRYHMYPTPE